MRVLIVDHEPLPRSALEQALHGGNDIETLDSTKDAIQSLEMMQEAKYIRSFSIRNFLALTSLIP